MRRTFLIVGTQRTGSQALSKALNLHPRVVCGEEWTQHVPWYRKISVAERALQGEFHDLLSNRPNQLARMVESLTRETLWLGFKILFRASDKWLFHPRLAPALVLDRLEAHIAWLKQRPDIHVIHLVRRDTVEWLKSKHMARATGRFTHHGYPGELKVTVPIGRALRAASAKAYVDGRLTSLRSSNPYKQIYYEQFLADNQTALESCLLFLNCDLAMLPEDLSFIPRQSKGTAENYIQNYDELVSALDSESFLNSAP